MSDYTTVNAVGTVAATAFVVSLPGMIATAAVRGVQNKYGTIPALLTASTIGAGMIAVNRYFTKRLANDINDILADLDLETTSK